MKLICGVHGVGKSFFAKKYCQEVKLKYYSASELIKSKKDKDISEYKKVQAVSVNQDFLLDAISEISDNDFILDGHLCLINSLNLIERIPFEIFQEMKLDGMCIVVDKPDKIQCRLKNRDNQIWNIQFIDLFQQEELAYAKYISSKMNIPLKIIYENEEVNNCSFLDKQNIILPIKPQFAELILNGEKKYEYRKKLCKKEINNIYIYATAPKKMIVGEAKVVSKIKMSKENLWIETMKYSGINKNFFDKYFQNQEYACAYEIGEVKKYLQPIALENIGVLSVPQSFIYVSELHI